MLKIRYSSRFKKDFKNIVKRGYNIKLLENILSLLINDKPLPVKNLDHPLSGIYFGYRECHIASDWLLIYKLERDNKTISLTRTGTHSDLF